MSGSRLTRKVTLDGSKKLSDANAPRKSVFDRLGPGTVERSQSRRDDYHESATEKCRHWLRDGRCPYGSKCRYNHGLASEGKSKVKIIRSIVSKTDESGDGKGEIRLKRIQSQDESSSDQSPKKTSKKHKSEKVKTSKDALREGALHAEGAPREQRRSKEEVKVVEKKKEALLRRSSSSGWNLQDQSDTDEENDGKQLDWEERGALNYEREVALEERRNDLRREIAKMDQRVEPGVSIPRKEFKSEGPVEHSHVMQAERDLPPSYHRDDVRPDKKKKSKSDKSKKKSKKKSHKTDVSHMMSEPAGRESELAEKTKKGKSPSSGKKKKRHENRCDSDVEEMQPAEVPFRKQEHQREDIQRDLPHGRRGGDIFPEVPSRDEKSKHRHSHEPRREKDPRQLHSEQPEKHFPDNTPRLEQVVSRKRDNVAEGDNRSDKGRRREDKLRKKQPQWSPSRQFKDVSYREQEVTEWRKSPPRSIPSEHREEKHIEEKHREEKHREEKHREEKHREEKHREEKHREEKHRSKKMGKAKEPAPSSRPTEVLVSKAEKPMVRHKERKRGGPRTPSPDVEKSFAVSRSIDPIRDSRKETPAKVARNRDAERNVSNVPSRNINSTGFSEVALLKPSIEKKTVVVEEANETISESSDSESSSSEESASCEVESVSGEEQRNERVQSENRVRDLPQAPKPQSHPSESKQEHRNKGQEEMRSAPPEHTVRSGDASRDQPFNEFREYPMDDGKEGPSEYDRREERGERYHRERPRDHRRPREDSPERRMENRAQKDARELRDSRDIRDHRDTRDYREPARMEQRDFERERYHDRDRERERYREFDERERERYPPPADVRRGEPHPKSRDFDDRAAFGRGAWTRDRRGRGRDGYGAGYDSREADYIERRPEGRPGQEYDRNYERDRPYPARGSRYREVSERHTGPWHEHRVERGYREPERERERFFEGRDRMHEDSRAARTKRPPRSPDRGRNDRRGYRDEVERRPCTPIEDSEEWDYEEGRSPVSHLRDQAGGSRKRPREQVSPRSPRSEAPKRKKAISSEKVSQDPPKTKDRGAITQPAGPAGPAGGSEKDREKESKKPKKERAKKTRKRKLSETETEAAENVEMLEPKRAREAEPTNTEKQAKKTKTKNQPEVVVRPWSDLENDDDDSKAQGKSENKTMETANQEDVVVAAGEERVENKTGDQVFSDWSDASEENALNKKERSDTAEVKENVDPVKPDEIKEEKQTKSADDDKSYDDVYDPISDDEFEAMFAGDEDEAASKKKTTPLPVDQVDWSILGTSVPKKECEPGDHIKRFSAGNTFSRIGLSSALAGPTLTKLVQEKCSQDAPNMKMKDLLVNPTGLKSSLGALVAAEARKIRERSNAVNDIGPCRRALCARRDFHIRKQLRKLTSTKLGAKLVLSNAAVEPVDSELFTMSVALFRRQKDIGVKPEPSVKSSVHAELAEVAVC